MGPKKLDFFMDLIKLWMQTQNKLLQGPELEFFSKIAHRTAQIQRAAEREVGGKLPQSTRCFKAWGPHEVNQQ